MTFDKAEYLREWRKKNPEKQRKYSKDYYDQNRETLLLKNQVNFKAYYEKNKSKVKAKHKEYDLKRRIEFRQFIDNLKISKGCVECGYNAFPDALHFDHRNPTDKKYNVANMAYRSKATLQEEIDKCDIRCANCHAIRTTKEKHRQPRKAQ